ncbi:MAG: hypothetical protein ACJ780_29850, partial [Solirubrobacteraceae bacterium]
MSKSSKGIGKMVNVDVERVVMAALDAALSEALPSKQPKEPKEQHHAMRTLATGAVVVTAAGVGYQRLPRLAKLPIKYGLRKVTKAADIGAFTDAVRDRVPDVESLRDRIADIRHGREDDDYEERDEYEYEGEEPEDEYEGEEP